MLHHYHRLTSSFPTTFLGLAMPVLPRVRVWVKSFWCPLSGKAQSCSCTRPWVSVHHTWIGAKWIPLVWVPARHVALKDPHPSESDTGRYLSATQGECTSALTFLCKYTGNHLSKDPPISVQSKQVHLVTSVDLFTRSEMHSTCLSCSNRQSVGPPDCCLLQFDHVGCDSLHVDGLRLVAPQMFSRPHAIRPTLRGLVVASSNQLGGRWLVLATTRRRWVCLTACGMSQHLWWGGPVSTIQRWVGSWTDGFLCTCRGM